MADETNTPTEDARRFHLTEDWWATIVGLVIVALAAAGVVTEGWVPIR